MKFKFACLVLILLIGGFLRFYKLQQFAGFDFDQELAVTKATEILNGDLALVGQEVSTGGIFVGPFYNYITVGLLIFSQGDPAIIYYFQAFLGIVSIVLVYLIAESYQSKSGLMAATLYVFSFRSLYIDKTAAPSNWLLFLTALTLFVYTRKFSANKKLLLTSSLVGFTSQLHPAGIGLLVLPLLLVFKKTSLKTKFISPFLFAFWFAPLVLFDLRHNFLNLRGLLSRSDTFDYPLFFRLIQRVFITTDTFITSISFERNYIIIALLLVLLLFCFKQIKKLPAELWLGLLANTFVFTVYKGSVVDYYFLPSLIFWFVILSLLFDSLWKRNFLFRPLILIFLFGFIFTNTQLVLNTTNPVSLHHKKMAMTTIKNKFPEQDIKIHVDADLGQNNGFTYLAEWLNIEANFTYQDPNVIIYVPSQRGDSTKTFGSIGLTITD